jgi:hypothetical protein
MPRFMQQVYILVNTGCEENPMANNRGGLGATARRLKTVSWRDFGAAFAPWLDPAAWFSPPARERLFSPARVFALFLSQVFSADGSCREALQKFLAWQALAGGKEGSPNTAAYCKARERLRQAELERARDDVAQKIQQSPLAQRRWHGRHVKVVDGSGISMPDTPENQEKYPQSKRRTPGCGFPEMRITALFSMATGVLLRSARGSRYVSERTLFRQLWDYLEWGDVILADRGFCGFAEFFFLLERGVDSVMRLHQRRTVGVCAVKRLSPGDTLVQWVKTKVCPKWLTKEQWAALPGVLEVRHIAFTVDIPGFRSQHFTIATTLTDPRKYPASAFADLYRRRWCVELYFRDIKISLGMDVLRCQTPEMIEKELAMHIIAYNLIRATMLQAAHAANKQIEQLSFKATCQALREWIPILALAAIRKRSTLRTAMLHAIANAPIPKRPNRTEPRARKRRPKNYPLLNKPRDLFKDTPHRNRYVKTP